MHPPQEKNRKSPKAFALQYYEAQYVKILNIYPAMQIQSLFTDMLVIR